MPALSNPADFFMDVIAGKHAPSREAEHVDSGGDGERTNHAAGASCGRRSRQRAHGFDAMAASLEQSVTAKPALSVDP